MAARVQQATGSVLSPTCKSSYMVATCCLDRPLLDRDTLPHPDRSSVWRPSCLAGGGPFLANSLVMSSALNTAVLGRTYSDPSEMNET